MNSHPTISICVPVYNVEKQLPRCIDSILNQSFEDFELVVINDASPDNSEEIVEKYRKVDSRIRYIKHETNRSLPQTRKTALEVVKGEYITFMDSDDWIDSNHLERLYKALLENDADISICDMCVHRETETKVLMINNLPKNPFSSVSWVNKLFRRHLFDNQDIIFPQHHFGEDLAVVPRMYYNAKKVIYTPIATYHYDRMDEKRWSITPDIFTSVLYSYQQILFFYRKKGEYGHIRLVRWYASIYLIDCYSSYFTDNKQLVELTHLMNSGEEILADFFDHTWISKYTRRVHRALYTSNLGFKLMSSSALLRKVWEKGIILFLLNPIFFFSGGLTFFLLNQRIKIRKRQTVPAYIPTYPISESHTLNKK